MATRFTRLLGFIPILSISLLNHSAKVTLPTTGHVLSYASFSQDFYCDLGNWFSYSRNFRGSYKARQAYCTSSRLKETTLILSYTDPINSILLF